MTIQRVFLIILICSVCGGFSDLSLHVDGRPDAESSWYVKARVGENVTLTCSPPVMSADVCISQIEYQANFYGALVVPTEHYEYEATNNGFQVIIEGVDESYSSWYGCQYCYKKRSCRNGGFCFRMDIVCMIDTAYLYVYASDSPESELSCVILNNTNGIYFVGDTIIIRCTYNSGDSDDDPSISIVNENDIDLSREEGMFDPCGIGDHSFCFPVDEVYNNASIECYEDSDHRSHGVNYCEGLPNVIVYNNLSISLGPKTPRVANRQNISFFCESNLYFLASFEWRTTEKGVTFGDIEETAVDGGMTLTVIDIDFTNSTSKMFNVSCEVRVGQRSAVDTATVSQEETTTPGMVQSSTPGPQNRSMDEPLASSVVVVVAPVIAGLALVCAIVVAFVWCRRSSSKGQATGMAAKVVDKKDGLDAEREPKNVYSHDWKSGDARLGYSSPDAKVVDNVAYVSYDDNEHQ